MKESNNFHTNHRPIFWITLISLFVFSLVAGFIGYQQYYNLHEIDHRWIRSLYCTLQLYVFEGGDVAGPIPILLDLARFTAPITTIMAFVMTLFEIFSERWNRIMISRMKNHVVIIGFGTKGKTVMLENRRENKKVLVVDRDPLNPNFDSARTEGCRILLGDATYKSTLRRARVTKAALVYLLTRDDNSQANACLEIYQLIKKSKRDHNNPLHCIMHLKKPEFLNTTRNHKIIKDIHDGLQLSIFNYYENSARELFINSPPDGEGIVMDSPKFVRIIIFGFGYAGQALALQTATTGHYINEKKAKVLVIDREANSKIPEFLNLYPTYSEFCDLDYLSLDADSPQLIHQLSPYLKEPDALNTIVLCFDDRTHNLLLGMQLENIRLLEDGKAVQLFARTDEDSTYDFVSGNMKAYGLPSTVCSKSMVVGEKLDKQAIAFHETYLDGKRGKPGFGKRESHNEWPDLPQEFKDSNRKVADHAGIKIRSIGCLMVDINDPRPEATFTKKEIEDLARLEHKRWWAERSLAGWTIGEEEDDTTRKSPHIIEWEDLPDGTKQWDRDQVEAIPKVLKKINKKIVRK